MNNVNVVNHPLVYDKISKLRNKNTTVQDFRQLIREISTILAVAATTDYCLKEISIETPLEITTGKVLARDPVLIPILRAGLGMVEGFLNILPQAKIGYLGVYRDESTLRPIAYYNNIPSNLEHCEIFVLDPMLATGGSANYCLSLIKQQGGTNIALVTIVSAPEGIEHLKQHHPDVNIITASVDRELNGHGYILPGLGDAGDRLNGTL